MPNKRIVTATFISIVWLCVVQAVSAQDWAQWRGPNRDGVVKDFVAPAVWPEKLPTSVFQIIFSFAVWPEKLKMIWKTEVGSGYSSPVVSKDRAWIHARKGEEEVVSCLDLKSGKILWSKGYPVAFTKNQYAKEMSKGPFSTPVLYNGKLYTLGVTAILS